MTLVTDFDKMYYEAFVDYKTTHVAGAAQWHWKAYNYDPTGSHEQIVARSTEGFEHKNEALDAAANYCDTHNIDAELFD